jgi:hypothetical protein
MALLPVTPISSVRPSGADLATTSAPVTPPAPGWFSTTTGCPREALIRSASRRARVSVLPTGGNGTTMRRPRPGQDCARTGPASMAANSEQ